MANKKPVKLLVIVYDKTKKYVKEFKMSRLVMADDWRSASQNGMLGLTDNRKKAKKFEIADAANLQYILEAGFITGLEVAK